MFKLSFNKIMKSLVSNFCLMTNKVSGIIIAKGMFNWKAQY